MDQVKNISSINRIIKELPNDVVIGEFAGRDSVAAIIKALEDESINRILPVASFSRRNMEISKAWNQITV